MCWALSLLVSLLPHDTRRDARGADGIVVLTGGGTRLERRGPVRKRRGQAAADQRRQPRPPPSETLKDVGAWRPALRLLRRYRLCRRGHPRQCRRKPRTGRTAINFHSLVVVTARYHMPRAMHEFSSAMPGCDAAALSGGSGQHRSRRLVAASAAPCCCCIANIVKYLASLVTTSMAAT